MNSATLTRAKKTLEELRKLLPDQAAKIDALARKLDSRNRDGLAVRVSATVSLVSQEERMPPCR